MTSGLTPSNSLAASGGSDAFGIPCPGPHGDRCWRRDRPPDRPSSAELGHFPRALRRSDRDVDLSKVQELAACNEEYAKYLRDQQAGPDHGDYRRTELPPTSSLRSRWPPAFPT